jgi:hypothetical protein
MSIMGLQLRAPNLGSLECCSYRHSRTLRSYSLELTTRPVPMARLETLLELLLFVCFRLQRKLIVQCSSKTLLEHSQSHQCRRPVIAEKLLTFMLPTDQ